jgi:hypothetical protein
VPAGRHISLLALQLVGLACLLVSAWMVYDGWRALGIFGVALLVVAELTFRRSPRPAD